MPPDEHDFTGYKSLAATVVRAAVTGAAPAEARAFCQSEIGRMWLGWLRLEPERILVQIDKGKVRRRWLR